MAGTYYTDLFILNQVESPSSDGSITEFTGATAGGTGGNQGKTDETDFFIQGAQCVSKNFNSTGVGGYGYDNGSLFNVPTDGAVYTWTYWAAPNSVSGKSTGGHQIHLGNSTSAYRRFYVDGSDTQQYGGWKCYPVNYTASANGTTTDQGTPNGTTQVIGYAVNNASNISKGNPYGLDVMRYGRGTIAVDSSVDSGTADFTTIASYNDKNSTGAVTGFNLIQTGFHRLGIFSLQDGVFQLQGRLLLGQGSAPITTEASGTLSASPVTFSDSNKTIFIQDSEFCQTGFNLIEVQNASSSVTFSNISINSLAGAAGNPARGNFLVTDAATVALSSCTFQNMGGFSLNTGTTATGCNFNTCGTVVQNGAQLTSCNFSSLATVNQNANVIVDTDTNLDGCSFVGGGFHYAVEIGNVSDGGSFNWNSTFDSSTFATSSRTGAAVGGDSEVIGLTLSGGTFTINVNDGVAAPTYHNKGSGTVVIANNVSLSVEGLLGNSEVRVYDNPSRLTGNSTSTEVAGVETVAAKTVGDLNNSATAITNEFQDTSTVLDVTFRSQSVALNSAYAYYGEASYTGTFTSQGRVRIVKDVRGTQTFGTDILGDNLADSLGSTIVANESKVVAGGTGIGYVKVADIDGSNQSTIVYAPTFASTSLDIFDTGFVAGYQFGSGGSVRVYQFDGTLDTTIPYPGADAGDPRFANAVSTNGTKVAVGAIFEDVGANAQQGRAYIFDIDGTNQITLTASDGAAGDQFGSSIHIDNDYVYVGAQFCTISSVSNAGAVYRYNLDGTGETKLTAPTPSTNESFGSFLTAIGSTVVVDNNHIIRGTSVSSFTRSLPGTSATAFAGIGRNPGVVPEADMGSLIIGYGVSGTAYMYDGTFLKSGGTTGGVVKYDTSGTNVVITIDYNTFTATELVDGDTFRVLIRDNEDNPTLQIFDEFTVSGTPTSTSITTTTLSSGFTSKFGSSINGPNSKTVTVEKQDATETFSLAAGTYDIAIFRTASQPVYFLGQSVSADGSIPVTQVVDRVYNNPA